MSSVLWLRRGRASLRPARARWKDAYTHRYPDPVVDLAEERVEALRRYDAARR
jgi:deoxyribodipyrimidine photolyase